MPAAVLAAFIGYGTNRLQALEKCYSIWICWDEIPKEAHYSISVYEMANTKNSSPCSTAKENYDLMTLVIIKLGNRVYNGSEDDEGYGLFRFLNAIRKKSCKNSKDGLTYR